MEKTQKIAGPPEIAGQDILIIGIPASGKTTEAKEYADKYPNHVLIHTDDYIEYGFVDSLYKLIEDIVKIKESGKNIIIEGVLGYRLLRKGVELDLFYPENVVEMILPSEKQSEIYKSERDPSKIKYLESFEKNIQKVLSDYLNMENPKPPKRWVYTRSVW